MSKFGTSALIGATALALAGVASAATVTQNGVLEDGDLTWDNPDVAASGQFVDVYEVTVDVSGNYGFYSFYPGDVGLDENMDGTLALFSAPFDVGAPGASLAFDDDYNAGDIALLDPFDDDAVGSNASGFEVALNAGETYFLAQSTFSDVPTSFGQPSGAYELTVTGPGNITIIPAPGVIAMFASAFGLGATPASPSRLIALRA